MNTVKFRLTAAALFFLLLQGTLVADVFSLFPFRGGGAASGVENALNGNRLWTEEVDINGHRMDLEVTLVNRTLEQALKDLRGQFKKGAAAINSNSLLFEVPLESGARKRYYLVALQGIIPMLQFSLILPKGFRNTPGAWRSELPLPPGARSLSVMSLPKRNSIYGSFSSPFPAQQTLADISRALQSGGWKSMSGKNRSFAESSGEIFMQENQREILIVSVQSSNSGEGCTGSLYLRKLPK